MSGLSNAELSRYSRHIMIPEFGIKGQERLKKARVLVVGTGGLGAPLLQYLAAAGVGTIGIVDFDIVEDSNLQRQVLFTTDDIGQSKVDAAINRLSKLNPHITLVPHHVQLTSENALDIIEQYDIVADGTDNFPTRYLVNDACVKLGKVNVYASIFRFEGQLSVFNEKDATNEYGPNFRDLFPEPPPPGLVPSCAEGGVIGVLPGILGSLQANEVIKIASGVGQSMNGRLLVIDAATMQIRTLKVMKSPDNQVRTEHADHIKLIDYEQFCGLSRSVDQIDVPKITVQELNEKFIKGEDFQLIDVREPHEASIANIGGLLIPKGEIENHIDEIDRNRPVIVHCKGGVRSADVIRLLTSKYGFDNLLNLEGGILAWSDQIDKRIPTY